MRTMETKSEARPLAASSGDAEAVRLLLDAGASLNVKDEFGGTALMEAVAEGWTEIARLFLGSGSMRTLGIYRATPHSISRMSTSKSQTR